MQSLLGNLWRCGPHLNHLLVVLGLEILHFEYTRDRDVVCQTFYGRKREVKRLETVHGHFQHEADRSPGQRCMHRVVLHDYITYALNKRISIQLAARVGRGVCANAGATYDEHCDPSGQLVEHITNYNISTWNPHFPPLP